MGIGVKLGAPLQKILADEVNVKKMIFNATLKNTAELDTTITAKLHEEGLLRDLVRMVQELRQKAGLAPKDGIVVMVDGAVGVKSSVQNNEKFFASEVGAKNVEYKRGKFAAEQATKIEDQEIWIGIRKK